MTLYTWPNIVFSICCGILVDKIGVRRVIIISWTLTIIGLSIIVYSASIKDYILLCFGRTIVGIGNEGLSMTIKLYAIEFFSSNEYGIVFAIWNAFSSIGNAINNYTSYRMYAWFGSIIYSLLLPLFIAPLVCIPLCLLMTSEQTGVLSKMMGIYPQSNSNTEDTKLMIEPITNKPEQSQNKFKLSDIKEFKIYFWILLTGFALWCGATQSSININISFIHHMFGFSYELATWIGLYQTGNSFILYMVSGIGTAKIGRRMEFLLTASVTGFIGQYIFGWINTSITWAFIGTTLKSMSIAFTYPVFWACIPLLCDEKVRGTAFGFATAIRFGTIAICYVIVGALTKEEDGGDKYIDVQLFILVLIVISSLFYIILYIMDIKWNNRILQKIDAKEEEESVVRKEGDLSMAKISFCSDYN